MVKIHLLTITQMGILIVYCDRLWQVQVLSNGSKLPEAEAAGREFTRISILRIRSTEVRDLCDHDGGMGVDEKNLFADKNQGMMWLTSKVKNNDKKPPARADPITALAF